MHREYSPEIKARLKELAQQDLYQTRRPRTDIVGHRFGRLVVQRPVGHAARGRLIVLSHCDCGGAKICTLDALRNGVKSCGCWEEERKPVLKKRKQFAALLERVVINSRTAKPVETETSADTQADIDIGVSHAIVAAENLIGGSDGTE